MIASVNLDITFLLFLGLIFLPRFVLLWVGCVTSGSFGAIMAFSFVPRIMICSHLSSYYGQNAPASLVVFWIFAVVLDIIGFFVRSKFILMMWAMQLEQFNNYYKYSATNRFGPY